MMISQISCSQVREFKHPSVKMVLSQHSESCFPVCSFHCSCFCVISALLVTNIKNIQLDQKKKDKLDYFKCSASADLLCFLIHCYC